MLQTACGTSILRTTHSSVTIGNGGNKPAKAELTILYNQGSEQYQVEQMLAPDEQMLVDFGKLIRNQVPDKNGHVLPPDLTSGAYRIRDLEHNPLGALYEGKVIVDKTYGHAAYGCGVCCGPDAPLMAFDPLAVSIDDYADQYIQALNSCGGGVQDFTDDFPTWWTGDTAIATANKNSIHGVAAGTTNHYAESDPMYWGIRKAFNSCPISRPQTTAGTKVQPTVTISGSTALAMLNSGATGGGNTTTLTATGNPSGGTYSWSAVSGQGNISMSNTGSQSVTIQAAAVGSYTVQVKYTVNNQPGTATTVGKVQQPGSLGVVSNDVQAFVCTNASPSYTTEERLIQYQVLDTSSPPVPVQALNMRATETLNLTSNPCGEPAPNPTVNETTGINGYFPAPDQLAFCSPKCLPVNSSGVPTGTCTATIAQTWTVNGYSVKSDTVSDTCPGPPTGAP